MSKKTKAKEDAALQETSPLEGEERVFDSVGELVVDVFETDSHFVVLSAIAGVKIQDLDISVEKDMMVISGQRQDPHATSNKKYFYQECYWGPFQKKIVLPENVAVDQADAQMQKGVLVIKIPKVDATQKESIALS